MRRFLLIAVLSFSAVAAARGAGSGEPVIVFFSAWSALIDQPAQQSVAAAAAAAKQADAPVRVTGYASAVGSAEANRLLAQLRAQVVADELVADGVDVHRITLVGAGATTFAADPQEARRVLINIGN